MDIQQSNVWSDTDAHNVSFYIFNQIGKIRNWSVCFLPLRFCVASLILTDHQEFLALFCPGMGHKSAIDDSNLGWFSGEWVRFKLTFGHAE